MGTHTFNSLYGFPTDTLDRLLAGDFSPVTVRGITPGEAIAPVGEVMARLWTIPGEEAWAAIERLHAMGVPLHVRAHANELDGLMSLALRPWDQAFPSHEALARLDRWVQMGGPLDQHVWGRTVVTEMAKANPQWLQQVASRGFTLMSDTRPVVDYLAQWGTPAAVEAVLTLPTHGGLADCHLETLLSHLVRRWQPDGAGESVMRQATRVTQTWLTVVDPWQGRLVATSPTAGHERSPVEVLATGLSGLDALPTSCKQSGTEVEKGHRRNQFLESWAVHFRPIAERLAEEAWQARDTLPDARGLWLAWAMKDGALAEQWAKHLPKGQPVHVPLSPMSQPVANSATAWVAGYLKLASRITSTASAEPARRKKENADFERALKTAMSNGVDVLGQLRADRREAQAKAQTMAPTRQRSRPRS